MITQEKFDKLFRTAKTDGDVCIFRRCARKPTLTIVRNNVNYGLCALHWFMVSESDVEWSSQTE